MDKKSIKFMQDNLGVDLNDIQLMTSDELDELYERAMDLEVEKAMEANGEITEQSELAAHVVDYIYNIGKMS
ncbi:MAG: hypothetical protein ACI3ZR_09015 [bacterium]